MNEFEQTRFSADAPPAASGASTQSSILPHACRVIRTVARAIRENPALRQEVIGLLHHIERELTPTEGAEQSTQGITTENETEAAQAEEAVPMKSENAVVDASSPTQRHFEPPPLPVRLDQEAVASLTQALTSLSGMVVGSPSSTRASVVVDARTQVQSVHRCARMKAKACMWAVERRNRIKAGADFKFEIAPQDRALISEAGQMEDCFLWMSTSSAPTPSRPEAYQVLGDCFENVAEAAELIEEVAFDDALEKFLEPALILGAEAQSAVREAVFQVGATQEDATQLALFRWLQEIARERAVYIPRFMRRTDVADPTASEDLSDQIGALAEKVQGFRQDQRREKSVINTIKHHSRQISPNRDNRHDWVRIFAVLEEVVPMLIKPSDLRLRQYLADKIDTIPEDLTAPPASQSVLDAIDQFLSAQTDVAIDTVAPSLNAEELRVRKWLKGKSIVIIGGDPRPHAKDALQSTFELSEVIWVNSRAHDSPELFEPAIRAPGVGLVLLAIRWSSHCFGAVKEYCDAASKPFARLPAGYNPKQVAHQVVTQLLNGLTN